MLIQELDRLVTVARAAGLKNMEEVVSIDTLVCWHEMEGELELLDTYDTTIIFEYVDSITTAVTDSFYCITEQTDSHQRKPIQ